MSTRLNELFGGEKTPEPRTSDPAVPPVEPVAKPPAPPANPPPPSHLTAAPQPAPVPTPAPIAQEATPRTLPPAPQVTLEREKRRSETFLVTPSITARVKSAVFYTPGLSQADLVDKALAEYVTKLEKARGEPFPKLEKGQKPRVGRPISL